MKRVFSVTGTKQSAIDVTWSAGPSVLESNTERERIEWESRACVIESHTAGENLEGFNMLKYSFQTVSNSIPSYFYVAFLADYCIHREYFIRIIT